MLDVPLANCSLSSLSPIIFGSVRFYHAISVGQSRPIATVADARLSICLLVANVDTHIFGVTTAAAGQLRTAPRHATEFSQDRTRQGSGLRILKIPIPQPATSCDFSPQNEPSRQSTILGSLLGRPGWSRDGHFTAKMHHFQKPISLRDQRIGSKCCWQTCCKISEV